MCKRVTQISLTFHLQQNRTYFMQLQLHTREVSKRSWRLMVLVMVFRQQNGVSTSRYACLESTLFTAKYCSTQHSKTSCMDKQNVLLCYTWSSMYYSQEALAHSFQKTWIDNISATNDDLGLMIVAESSRRSYVYIMHSSYSVYP